MIVEQIIRGRIEANQLSLMGGDNGLARQT